MTVFTLTIIIFIMGSPLCKAGDTLLSGQTLSGNQTLVSKNGIYELGFFVDSFDSYFYLGIRLVNFSDNILWVANTGNHIYDPFRSELNISSTGNLVLTKKQKLIWSTNLTRLEETTSTIAVLLDTGNLVLKEDDSVSKRTVWQSFDHPTNKMNICLQIPTPKYSHRAHLFIIMLAIGVMAAALLVGGLLVSWKRKEICLIFNLKDIPGDKLVAFTYAETKIISMNFFHKLGEGGFGSVFKGSLPNSTVVAVKRMKNAWFEDKHFRTEVQTIGIIQHINLVKLLGFCSEGTKRLLVYEYMPNGSLDSHLFSNQCIALTWNTRYEILVGIARGLTYLHEECRDCIIHCDIKPENILLDANFCPKIADFGMAKLLGRDFSRALTTFTGTIGYLGPEWICGQPITKKADVYSFGMMLFEIISGKRNTEKFQNPECTYFPLYAAMKIRQGEIGCLLDDRLQGNVDMGQLIIACRVACWCIQEMETDRPSMREVVQMLEGVVKVLMPPIPSFLQRLVDLENDSMYSVLG